MSDDLELPNEGDLLADKYRILKELGRGGMGAVYKAHHEILDRTVAIKFLLPDIAENPQAVARFLNEARASARLNNEHIAAVIDVGSLPNGCAFMVLEYLEGCDLAKTLETRGKLPMNEGVEYVLQGLEAVAQAHAAGIIHRDLKPANLFLTRRADGLPTIKVLDFGISKATTTSNTATNTMLGSPAYMSPEQIESSKHVDPRSDIWSIGVILYQLLSGELPFKGEQFGAVFAAIFSGTYTPLAQVCPELPPALCQAVDRCLQQEREQRFQNVGELAEALKDFAFPEAQLCVGRIHRLLQAQKHVATQAVSSSTRPLPVASVTPSHPPDRSSSQPPKPIPLTASKQVEPGPESTVLDEVKPAHRPPLKPAPKPVEDQATMMLPPKRAPEPLAEDDGAPTAIRRPVTDSMAEEDLAAALPKRRTPLYVGGAVALVAIIGAVLAVSGVFSSDPPPPEPQPLAGAPKDAPKPTPTPAAEPDDDLPPPPPLPPLGTDPAARPADPTVAQPADPAVAKPAEPTAADPVVAKPADPVVAKPADPVAAKPADPAVAKPQPTPATKPVARPVAKPTKAAEDDFLNDRQ